MVYIILCIWESFARLLVSEWHLQIWTCDDLCFCCRGVRPRTRKHDHNSLSRFCWGAKGSRKGGVKAVLGYHNFEQHPHDKLFKLAGAEQTCLQRSEAWRIGQCGNSVGSKWIKAWSHIYIPCATMEYQKLYYSYLVVKHLARSNGA